MEVRLIAPTLTTDQQKCIDAFNDIIARNDSSQIIQAIIQLQAIPDEFSPIRNLAREKDGFDKMMQCIAMIKSAVGLKTKEYLADEITAQTNKFNTALNHEVLDTLDFNILRIASSNIYLHLVFYVYSHAAWAYAYLGNTEKVDDLNIGYIIKLAENEKNMLVAQSRYTTDFSYLPYNGRGYQHLTTTKVVAQKTIDALIAAYETGIAKKINLFDIKKNQSIYFAVINGYCDAERYASILAIKLALNGLDLSLQCHAVERFIAKNKFDEMISFIDKNGARSELVCFSLEACYKGNFCAQIVNLLIKPLCLRTQE